MFRWMYLALLRLHPRAFRERFGDEMTAIFEEQARSGKSIGLLFDGLSSLFRQRFLRPARPEPSFSMASPGQPSGIPVFHTFDSSLPRRSALVNGAVLSLICLGLLNFANSRGGVNFPRLLIGAKYPRPLAVPVDRSSVKEAEPTTEIKVKAPAVDPLYELADVYFKIIRVLDVLDADRDRVVSPREIAAASPALAKLDADGDGRLSGEECGFFLGNKSNSKPDDQFADRARLEFMRLNPVLATLDSDRNGNISASEIRGSAVALTALDRNGDGSLTPHELLPIPIDNRTAVLLSRLDSNLDRQISEPERNTEEAGPLRELLKRADRNQDGMTTASELTDELQFRDEMKRHIDNAMESINPPQQNARPR